MLAADAALAAAPTPAPVWHLLVAVLGLLASALAALTPGARAPSNRILES